MRINLLPPEERRRNQPRVDGARLAGLSLVLAVFFVAALTTFHVLNLRATQAKEAVLLAEVTALRAEQQTLAAQRAENDAFEAALADLARSIFVEQNLATIRLLADSTHAVPEGVRLDLLAIDSGRSVYASGYAEDTGDLSQMLRNLEAVPGVEHVQLQTMERVQTLVGLRRPFSIYLTTEGAADDAAADDSSEDELAAEEETP